jgi:hypothetical protein
MSTGVDVNADSFRKALIAFNQKVHIGLEYAAYDGAQVARDWVEDDMNTPKSGRQWPWLPHVSSAPGETPAVQFGALVESLDVVYGDTTTTTAKANFVAGSGRAPYAFDLEFGGYNLAPRPFMRPSVDRNRKKIVIAAAEGMMKWINRG